MRRSIRALLGVMATLWMLEASPVLAGNGDTRLIIRFSETVFDPTQPAVLTSISEVAGHPMSYLRPMSGQAHVFVVGGVLEPAQLQQIIERLQASPEVFSVEHDLIVNTQTGSWVLVR